MRVLVRDNEGFDHDLVISLCCRDTVAMLRHSHHCVSEHVSDLLTSQFERYITEKVISGPNNRN